MDDNPFVGWQQEPSAQDLAVALGKAHARWVSVVARLASDLGASGLLWRAASAKSGWSLRVLKGERVVVYLLPRANRFEASLALGAAALADARSARLSSRAKAALDGATKYPEGWGVRFEVASLDDAASVVRLAQAKLSS